MPTPEHSKQRILLIDDDAQLADMLHEYLEKQGFDVQAAQSGEDGLELFKTMGPDLVVLDVMLPGMNGFEVLNALRQIGNTPVVMLTARGEEGDRILGLMGGADDYLPKPFNPLELSARVKAVLKRSAPDTDSPPLLTAGPITLDTGRCELRCNDTPVQLTAAELNTIEHLLRHQGEVMSRARLTELALKRPLELYDRSIDTIISRIRSKLEKAGIPKECIKSLRGHGYVLDTDSLEP